MAVCNILIVDDLLENHLVFESILSELGQNLVMVRSGREALRCVLESEFAVILLDVNMPDIDGLETATLLRQYKRTAQTPILFITAYMDDTEVTRGYSLGAVDYIASPLVPEILRSKVKVFVELNQKTQQLRAYAEEREALVRAEAARDAALAATQRADFLAQAGQQLAQSLDLQKTAIELLELTVPRFAICALLALIDTNQQLMVARIVCQSGNQTLVGDAELAWSTMEVEEVCLKKLRGSDFQEVNSAALHSFAQRTFEQAGAAIPKMSGAMGLPFVVSNRMSGIFVIGQAPGLPWAEAQMSLVREIVGRAAIAFENAALYRAIQEEDQRKNQFLAMLAHELRNPMAPISNAVHILRGLNLKDATVAWAGSLIGRQITHMTRMVDDLLDASRISQGKISVRKSPVALKALIESAEEAIKPILTERKQILVVEAMSEGVIINGDPVRLAQALSNLLHNASKFSEPGKQIFIRSSYGNGRLTLSVVDQGAGIDHAFLPHVFDLFAQDNQTLDRSHGGLGIGLTLVKHLVELHGGSVGATSAGPGQGSTFAITLPASRVDSAGSLEEIEAVASRGHSPTRILVVEDQEDSANTLKVVLGMHGHKVETAADGREALTRFKVFRPDVVLLDIGLPGMTGFEVAQEMRSTTSVQCPLLIALTGYGQAEDRARSASSGFDYHIVKPADIPKLLALIDGHILLQTNLALESRVPGFYG